MFAVNVSYHFRLEGGLNLSVLEAIPINSPEEGMLSDVPLPLRAAAQTLGRVLGHQLLKNIYKKNKERKKNEKEGA